MDFRGHLRLPEDAGSGIPVALRLDDIFLVISSGEEELGTWRADDVVIERIFSNQFSIELDGESMLFIAQDALSFAYEGISAIEDLQERLTKRRVFKRSKKKTKPVETDPATAPAATASEFVPEVPADQELAHPAATDEEGDEPAPFEPTAIWSPPSPSSTPPPVAPVAPGAEPSDEAEIPEPSPDDVRVSYPQPSAASPRVESPPAESAPVVFEPADAADDEPPSEPPAAPVEKPPVPAQEPEFLAVEPDEPEYDIEEVSPAATGATWSDDVSVQAEEAEPPIEIEEWVLPAAGAVDMFATVEPEDDLTEVPQQPVPETEEAPAAVDIPAEPAGVADSEPEGRHLAAVESETEEPELEEVAEITEAESAPSNGHRRKDVSARDGAAGKRERRNLLFGRSRDKKVPPHDHRYGDPKTIGGLTRQVCEVCGHVTFSGEDVYQGW